MQVFFDYLDSDVLRKNLDINVTNIVIDSYYCLLCQSRLKCPLSHSKLSTMTVCIILSLGIASK